jgi:Kef-type K+ transport system membrane component KefB
MEAHSVYITLFGIGLALLVAVLLGQIFDRLKIPPLLGQILGGLLIGNLLFTSLFGSLEGVELHLPVFTDEAFEVFGTIGILLLMFLTGLEIKESDLVQAGKHSFVTAIIGMGLPLGAGLLLANRFGWSFKQSLILGLIMAPTSIGITAVTLVDLNRLRTREGLTMMGAAIFDDVMVIIGLAIILATGSIGGIAVKIAGFFFLIWLAGRYLLPRIAAAGYRMPLKGGGAALMVVVCIFAAFLAESLQVAAVTGAFLAGMFLASSTVKKEISRDIESVAGCLFIPLFFFFVGSRIDISALIQSGLALLLVIPVAMISKIGGGFLGAWLSGLRASQALPIGIGISPRLEFPIIISLLAVMRGIFSGDQAHELLGLTMGIVVSSIILTPLLLKSYYFRVGDITEIHEHHL